MCVCCEIITKITVGFPQFLASVEAEGGFGTKYKTTQLVEQFHTYGVSLASVFSARLCVCVCLIAFGGIRFVVCSFGEVHLLHTIGLQTNRIECQQKSALWNSSTLQELQEIIYI